MVGNRFVQGLSDTEFREKLFAVLLADGKIAFIEELSKMATILHKSQLRSPGPRAQQVSSLKSGKHSSKIHLKIQDKGKKMFPLQYDGT